MSKAKKLEESIQRQKKEKQMNTSTCAMIALRSWVSGLKNRIWTVGGSPLV